MSRQGERCIFNVPGIDRRHYYTCRTHSESLYCKGKEKTNVDLVPQRVP